MSSGVVLLMLLQIVPGHRIVLVCDPDDFAETPPSSRFAFLWDCVSADGPVGVSWNWVSRRGFSWPWSAISSSIWKRCSFLPSAKGWDSLPIATSSGWDSIRGGPHPGEPAAGPLLFLGVVFFYPVGIGVLQSRELVRRGLREATRRVTGSGRLAGPDRLFAWPRRCAGDCDRHSCGAEYVARDAGTRLAAFFSCSILQPGWRATFSICNG